MTVIANAGVIWVRDPKTGICRSITPWELLVSQAFPVRQQFVRGGRLCSSFTKVNEGVGKGHNVADGNAGKGKGKGKGLNVADGNAGQGKGKCNGQNVAQGNAGKGNDKVLKPHRWRTRTAMATQVGNSMNCAVCAVIWCDPQPWVRDFTDLIRVWHWGP